MTTIVPEQRTAVGRYRRELEVILARAPSGAAVVVGCAVPPGTCGPPLHIHAASDETFFVLSGVLLVHADGRVATIPEGGLVHVGPGVPHTFAAAPGSPARFLMLHTPGKSGEFYIATAHTVQDHGGPLPRADIIRVGRDFDWQPADPPLSRGCAGEQAGRSPAEYEFQNALAYAL